MEKSKQAKYILVSICLVIVACIGGLFYVLFRDSGQYDRIASDLDLSIVLTPRGPVRVASSLGASNTIIPDTVRVELKNISAYITDAKAHILSGYVQKEAHEWNGKHVLVFYESNQMMLVFELDAQADPENGYYPIIALLYPS